MCIVVAADRVTDELLEDDRLGRVAVDLEVEHGAGVRERVAQLAASIWNEIGSLPPP